MHENDGLLAARVLESMGSGMVGIDGEGRVVLLNRGARELLADSMGAGAFDDAIGSDCRDVFLTQPTLATLLLESLQGGGGLSRAELELAGASGHEPTLIGLTLFPLLGDEGRREGAAMLFRDLSPIEASAEQDALKARLAALGQMAAGLAHELRNPLAAIELIVGLLKRRVPDGEPRELVDDLHGQVRALTGVVKTSLDFVKSEVPKRRLRDPGELVEAALARVLPRFPSPLQIERQFEPDIPAAAVDAEALILALSNLIANACQAMESTPPHERRLVLEIVRANCLREPSVRMGAVGASPQRKPAQEVVIRVADNGPGIAPAIREKIFYPFFTTRAEGSGIGLATVQKVIASHGGTVSLESRPGQGARFSVHLPVESVAGDA